MKHLTRVGCTLESTSPKMPILSFAFRGSAGVEPLVARYRMLHVSTAHSLFNKQLLAVPLQTTKIDNIAKRNRVTWLHTKDPSKKRDPGVLLGTLRTFEKSDLKQMRREGFVPGRIQEQTGKLTYVKIEEKCLKQWPSIVLTPWFLWLMKHADKLNASCKLFDVRIDGLEPMKCFIRKLAYDTCFDDVIYNVNLLKFEPEKGQKVLVEIPFIASNTDKSPGLRRGGLLNINMTKVRHGVVTGYNAPPLFLSCVPSLFASVSYVISGNFPDGLVLAPLPQYKHDVILTVQQTRASLGKE
eukprot:748970-Hanusia_phi.AAC.2